MPTIGIMIEHFTRAYGLKDFSTKHDAAHVMTGFDIGGIHEARINAVLDGMAGKNLDDACEGQEKITRFFDAHYKQDALANADDSIFENKKCRHAFSRADGLKIDEIAALLNLGRQMGSDIRKKTGKSFEKMTDAEVRALDFAAFDYTAQAQEIRQRYSTPKNRRIESMARNMLEQESLHQKGTSLIPPPKTLWTQTVPGNKK